MKSTHNKGKKNVSLINICIKIYRENRKIKVNTHSNKIKLPHKHIILHHNSSSNFMENNLNKLGTKTVTLSFKTIRDSFNFSSRRNIMSDAGIYSILCKDCKLKYIGEAS